MVANTKEIEGAPAEARRERLAELVAARGYLRVAEAAEWFAVSEVTVRADLAALVATGRIRRVHGGAMPVAGPERESPIELVAQRDAAAKRAIGRRTAALVRSGGSVLLDVGSTTLAVAEALVERSDLTELVVVTNGLSIALALEPAIPRFTVVLTGGTLRPLQHSLVDPVAVDTLGRLHADLAVIGCNGIDADGRVTNLNLPEAEVKRAMIAASATHVFVADTGKLGARHLGLVGVLDERSTIVTAGAESDAVAAVRRAAATAGARLLVADAA